jgi:hypothetical protein
MKICVPSSNRAGKTTTHFIRDAIFFVPEDQISSYKEKIDNQIISVPDVFFGITKTRNYIIDFFSDEDILFLDDDVLECGYFKKTERINLKKDEFSDAWVLMFENCFRICEGLGLSVWGAENGGSKFSNHALNQISLKGSVNGTILGVRKNSFKYDEAFTVKEDFDLVIRAFKKEGAVLKFNNYYWRAKHWGNKGGCVDYRTNKIEEDCIKLLNQKHPGYTKQGKKKNKYHTTLKF